MLQVRSLSNLDATAALRACEEAAQRNPLATELHYLHAVLLLSQHRDDDAVRAVRRVLYLDRSLAVAHLTLGSILERRGDLEGGAPGLSQCARPGRGAAGGRGRALSDGEQAGRLAEAAAMQLAILEAGMEAHA